MQQQDNHETWFILNECVLMHEGEFLSNPFVLHYDIPPATIWVIENKDRVMRIIRAVLKSSQYRYLPVNEEDCYERILHFFIFENAKQNFIPFVAGEIDLDAYCTMHLKNLIRNYIRDLKPKQSEASVVSFLQGDEVAQGYGVNIETVTAKPLHSTSIFDTAFKDLDRLFRHLCEDYRDYFFAMRGYRQFDVQAYFTYMYFEVNQLDILKHMQQVSIKTNIPIELLTLVSAGLREDLVQQVDEVESIFDILKELILENKERGWKPLAFRGDN